VVTQQLQWDWARRRKKRRLTERRLIAMQTASPAAGGLHDWTSAALRALALRRRYGLGRLFQVGGVLARVRPAAPGAAARIEPLDEDSLRTCLAEVCDFDDVRCNTQGDDVHRVVAPPREILRTILSQESYDERRFPPLELLASSPIVGTSGRLLVRRGYYRRSRIWMEPSIALPPVPTRPTRDEVRRSVDLILQDYLGDFPFADEAARAHTLGAILLPLVRRLISGPTPLHLALAASPGTGKTLLLIALSLIAASAPVEPQPMRDDESEVAKALLAVLMSGPQYILFDNLKSLDSATLALAIASPACRFGGRFLGATRWVEVPVQCTWLASGNNPRLSRELVRRTVLIKLATDSPTPWTRQGFAIPALVRWGTEHRAELLHAALSIAMAWVAEGMPKGAARLGGFESWAETMGGLCQVAEVEGFLANRDELLGQDEEGLRWSALAAAWWRRHGPGIVSIDDIYTLLAGTAELEVAFAQTCGQGADKTQKQRLGREVARVQGRVFGSGSGTWRVEIQLGSHRGFPFYRLVPITPPREPGADDDRDTLADDQTGGRPADWLSEDDIPPWERDEPPF
jgi:putative DNA primase/helicase